MLPIPTIRDHMSEVFLRILLFVIALSISPTVVRAQTASVSQDLKSFSEPFFLMAEECQSTVANMRAGKLVIDKGTTYLLSCKPTSELTVSCDYQFDDKGKSPPKNRIYNGGIIGLQAVFQDMDGGDVFLINLTAGTFASDSKIALADGLMRGRKICAGAYIPESEYRRSLKKK